MLNFKENVLFVLKKRGLNQTVVSRRLGVTKQAFQYYLRGNISLETLDRIATAIDTTPAALLSEVPLSEMEAIPTRQHITSTTLVCPSCGAELKLIAKGEPQKEKKEGE